MNHIDEKTLELYLLDASEVRDQHAEIESHLKECTGCAALHQEMMHYYEEVAQLKEEGASEWILRRSPYGPSGKETSEALTLRRMIVRVSPFADRMPVQQVPATVPARIVLFVIRHYVVSSVSFLSLIVGALLLLYPRTGVKDTNPAYARAKDEFLIVYNKNGDELWKKHIGFGYDIPTAAEYIQRNPEEGLTTVDVNRDGRKEIISIFGCFRNALPDMNAIVCYNDGGSVRWKYEFHRTISFGGEELADDYRIVRIMTGDFNNDGKIEIAAVAQHIPFYPTCIFILDAANGGILGEYWHSGYIMGVHHVDLDADGIEELLFGGNNNGFDLACLFVLDPRAIKGHGPSSPSYIPDGIEPGVEKFYLTFPRSDFQDLKIDKRNTITGIRILSGESTMEVVCFEATRIEKLGDRIELSYFLDFSMKCLKVVGHDNFVTAHKMYESEGKLKRSINDAYYEELRQGVKYWDGEKSRFVHHEELMRKSGISRFPRFRSPSGILRSGTVRSVVWIPPDFVEVSSRHRRDGQGGAGFAHEPTMNRKHSSHTLLP